jgi:phosphate/sulfate permease
MGGALSKTEYCWMLHAGIVRVVLGRIVLGRTVKQTGGEHMYRMGSKSGARPLQVVGTVAMHIIAPPW